MTLHVKDCLDVSMVKLKLVVQHLPSCNPHILPKVSSANLLAKQLFLSMLLFQFSERLEHYVERAFQTSVCFILEMGRSKFKELSSISISLSDSTDLELYQHLVEHRKLLHSTQTRSKCSSRLLEKEKILSQKHGQEVCLYTSTILFYSLFYRLRRMGYLCARRQRLTNVELGSRAFQGLLNHPYAGVRAPEYAPHGPFNLL